MESNVKILIERVNDKHNKSNVKHITSLDRLMEQFFNKQCCELARALLGTILVRQLSNGVKIRAKIVETEAYLGHEDKAAHSYNGRCTARNKAMFMTPGDGCAVLLRAAEAVSGVDVMMDLRQSFRSSKRIIKSDKYEKPHKSAKTHESQREVESKDLNNDKVSPQQTTKLRDLCNGPSKLCICLNITKEEFDQTSLVANDKLWLEAGEFVPDDDVVTCPRINIGYAEEWKIKPLRFYINSSRCVSQREKR